MYSLSVQGVDYYQVIGTCANGSVVVVSQIVYVIIPFLNHYRTFSRPESLVVS